MLQDDKKINNIAMKAIFIVIVVAIFFVSVSIVNVFKKRKDVEAEIQKTKKENVSLREKKNELVNLLDYFQDKSFIEKEARRRLNLQKPGEKEVVVINDKNNSSQTDSGKANISDVANFIRNKLNIQESADSRGNSSYNLLKWFKFIFK